MIVTHHCATPLVALTALLLVALAPSPGMADARRSAALLEEEAVTHYRAGRFSEAAASFLAAYEADPTPVLLYNAGRSYERLGCFTDAVDTFERLRATTPTTDRHRRKAEDHLPAAMARALETHARLLVASEPPGASIRIGAGDSSDRTPAQIWLPYGRHRVLLEREGFMPRVETVVLEKGAPAELDVRLTSVTEPAYLEVSVLPDGARVEVDGKLVGTAPLAGKLAVSPGVHIVRAVLDDLKSDERPIQTGPGKTVRTEFDLRSALEPPPVALTAAPSETEESGFRYPWYAWSTTGLTAAGLITGVVCHAVAAGDAADARSYAKRPDADRERWQSMDEEVTREMTGAYVGYGVAGAAAVATAIILILENTGDASPGAVTIAPATGGGGFELSVSF